MECFNVKVPEGARLTGYTAAGRCVPIAPGEYLVHRLPRRGRIAGVVDALRFVGADHRGCDIHLPLPAAKADVDVDVLKSFNVERLASASVVGPSA